MAKKPGIIGSGLVAALIIVLSVLVFAPTTYAGRLTTVSDLITNSAPNESGSHTITFTTANAIPASGKIIIGFRPGGVTNLAALDFGDVDVASASDYTLAAAPSGGTLGVTFTASGLEIVLGNTAIAGGTALTVELGPVATYGTTGDTALTNSATLGSYTVDITTKTSTDTVLDYAQAVYVLVQPVGLSGVVGSMTPTPTPTPGGGGGGGASPTPTPLTGLAFWPDANPNPAPNAFGSRLLDTAPVDAPETTIGATVTNSGDPTQLGVGGNPISFVTAAGVPAMSVIGAGAWEFDTYAMATDAGGHTSLVAAVYIKHTDGTEELLFEHQITAALSAYPTHYSTSTYQPEFSILPTDQIVLRYYAQTGGSTGPVDVTVFYQGTNQYSHFTSPPYYTPVPSCFRIADFNGDCCVNITDFSILMANWGPNPRNPLTDINKDGSAGIIDLSILLYWWGGCG